MNSQAAAHIRPRALILGILAGLMLCAATPYNNVYKQATPLAGGHFPLAPFFIILWLSLAIAGIKRFFGRELLYGGELLCMWMLMTLVSGIAYTGLARTFFINLTAPFHFATSGNRWEAVLHPFLPKNWFPSNGPAVKQLYNGLPGGRDMSFMEIFGKIDWGAWLGPLFIWGVFIFLSYGAMLCIVNLFSRQWIHNERMNFPLLRVPQMMSEAADQESVSHFLSNRFLLLGLMIPVFLHLLNGLSFYYPRFPQIPTLILAGPYFPKYGLFSGFHKLKIFIYPAFIGLAFLTARQISLSFCFFYLAGGLLFGLFAVMGYSVPASALGTTFGPTLARPEETQMIGAYGVFFFFILWLARHHLREAFSQLFSPKAPPPSESEWLSLQSSLWGTLFCVSGLMIWCACFGLPLIPSAAFIFISFMVMLVASRVICQGGLAYFTLTAAPIDGLIAFFGAGFFGKAGLAGAAIMQKMLFLDLRESLMPSLFHAGQITQKLKNRRAFFVSVCLILALGAAISLIAMLTLCYKYGVRDLQPEWAVRTTQTMYDNVRELIENPVQDRHWIFTFSGVGAVVMLLLVLCYQRFYWWPLHPVGYLTAYSSAMRILWFSFLVGWMCNALCMRYGGVLLFKKLRYFFIGLIIGDFFMGGFWALIGLFSDAAYQVLPL